ncbi:MAG: hypothetical protein ACRDT4_13580 [Micromonosporaceae bacterium]
MVDAVWARVYKWRNQPPLPSVPPPGPVDLATWRLLWRVYAIRPQRVRMVASRLGLTGGKPVSLAQLGRDHNLSRQRIRQICVQADRAARRVGPPSRLRPVVFGLEAISLSYEDALVAEFIDEGLLAEPLRVEAIAAVADLFGVPVTMPETLAVVDGRRVLAHVGTIAEVRRWRSRLVVAGMVAPVRLSDLPPPPEIPREMVGTMLASDARLAYSPDVSVVWRADRLSTAADLVVRMLSTGPQTMASLLEGIIRRYARRYELPDFNPPCAHSLGAYLAAQPWVRVTGDQVALTGPVPATMHGQDRVFFDTVAGSRYRSGTVPSDDDD